MRIENELSFQEVHDAFLHENDLQDKYNQWAIGAIQIAEEQLGHWRRVILSDRDILRVMLPHHTRCGPEIVPPSCSTVAEAIQRLKQRPHDDPCRKKAEDSSRNPASLIFLSVGPIDHPDYADYRALVESKYQGLTHLDGLHRLMGWGLAGRSDIVSYVAGARPDGPPLL
jgi:Family of unknown function (DUF6309)